MPPSANQLLPESIRWRLLDLFSISAPRYTSYPTADNFVSSYDATAYREDLGHRRMDADEPLSLYVHIPFCESVCYYCACNKVITKNHAHAAKYVRYLVTELALQAAAVNGGHNIGQLHFGGGTPTFLDHAQLRQLMKCINKEFRLRPDGEYSIEVDPRKVDDETVALLAELGLNRMSLGVQDLDYSVQKAVNRVQTAEQTQAVVTAARANGFRSISIDLIYGLPGQTPQTFADTLEKVIALGPDRLSVYNYAHMPRLFKPQRHLNEADLPDSDTKLAILQSTIYRLLAAGYDYIGMDHFARPDDELAIAARMGRLQRNFQGYSTHAGCDLLAFGMSAIAKVGDSYSQNFKSLKDYYDCLDRGQLPVARGLKATPDDLLRRFIIHTLMCQFEVSIEAVESRYLIDFQSYFSEELPDLRQMEDEGLLTLSERFLTVLPAGRLLVRAIAAVFDRYLSQAQPRVQFSNVI